MLPGTWVVVLLRCLCAALHNMSSFKRDGEIRKMLTIIGKKVMQSHLTKTLKDGAIYEKEELWRNFPYVVGIKNMVSKIKNMLVCL